MRKEDFKAIVMGNAAELSALTPEEVVIFVDFMQFALPRVLSGEDPEQVYIAWQAEPEMKGGENNGTNT